MQILTTFKRVFVQISKQNEKPSSKLEILPLLILLILFIQATSKLYFSRDTFILFEGNPSCEKHWIYIFPWIDTEEWWGKHLTNRFFMKLFRKKGNVISYFVHGLAKLIFSGWPNGFFSAPISYVTFSLFTVTSLTVKSLLSKI